MASNSANNIPYNNSINLVNDISQTFSQPILFSIPCFHRNEILYNLNIKKCEYTISTAYTIFHVIYLKEPLSAKDTSYKNVSSVFCKYNNVSNEILEIWEQISKQPNCSLYSLEVTTQSKILEHLISQTIKFICNLINAKYVCKLLLKFDNMKNIKFFLSNFISIAYAKNPSFDISIVSLFRFTHKNITNEKNIAVQLRNQLFSIFYVIKYFFFSKSTSKNKINTYNCKENCKLSNYKERFNTIDYNIFHKFFCQICSNTITYINNIANNTRTEYNNLYNFECVSKISILFPYMNDEIVETISFVKSIQPINNLL